MVSEVEVRSCWAGAVGVIGGGGGENGGVMVRGVGESVKGIQQGLLEDGDRRNKGRWA